MIRKDWQVMIDGQVTENGKNYEYVDIDGLCELLAESAWEDITHKKPEEDLYDMIIQPDGSIKKEVCALWANEFFNMLKIYKLLANQFRKYPKREIDI